MSCTHPGGPTPAAACWTAIDPRRSGKKGGGSVTRLYTCGSGEKAPDSAPRRRVGGAPALAGHSLTPGRRPTMTEPADNDRTDRSSAEEALWLPLDDERC